MKIRILDSSIRLRLDRAEVDRIGAGESVTATTEFPNGAQFTYALAASEAAAPTASFEAGCMTVWVPREEAHEWATDETRVGIHTSQAVKAGELKLLIEKDFECLDPREGEDQSNRFVNPKATTA